MFLIFLDESKVFWSLVVVTNKVFESSTFKFFKTVTKSFVLGALNDKSSRIKILDSWALYVRADFLASDLTFLLSLKPYILGLGPNTLPPPLNKGFLIDPALAVPVPFCFLIFLVLPFISPLSLDWWVPCLWFAKYCLTSR